MTSFPKQLDRPTGGATSPHDALASLRIERPDPNVERNARKRRWWWLVGLVMIVSGSFFAYRTLQSESVSLRDLLESNAAWLPEIMQNRVEVRLISLTVQQGRAADALVVATGYLQSKRQAGIGARAAGRVESLSFEEGSQVRKGDVLAELEHRELNASQAASEASLQRAKAALVEQQITIEQTRLEAGRSEKLWRSRSISEAEYDQARFAHRTAEARLDTLRAEIALAEAQLLQVESMVENMFIRAPFDGTVISKDAELGESILPGGMGVGSGRGSVATIADLKNLLIECDVKEDFISRVSEGQEVDISVDAVPTKKYHGRVYKIIPMGDRARATIKVQVVIDDADHLLFPEMSGTAYFLPQQSENSIGDAPRIFCQAAAVDLRDEKQALVWSVDSQSRAKKIAVMVGEERNGQREVLDGLTGRERVIANPEGLQNGKPLKIAE